MGQVLDFLQSLVSQGLGYSTVNCARSALSLLVSVDGTPVGEHREICRFMKGVSNIRPSLPRYVDIWDPEVVLTLLKRWAPAQKLSFKLLTLKTVMLLLLVTGRRPQIIHKLNTDNMNVSSSAYKFIVPSADLKEGRTKSKPDRLILKKYPGDKRLCIFHYMSAYLQRSLDFRGKIKEVFITTTSPYTSVSPSTVARWVKTVLGHAGINTKEFTAGSVRAAASSQAKRGGATIDEILAAGGWSRESTFTKYYCRPIKAESSFADKVLQKK